MSNYKATNTCGKPTPAECVDYETDIPESSVLSDETCVNIEQTTEDLYTRTEKLLSESDLSALGENCLTYVQVAGENVTKNVLLKHEEEICDLKTSVDNILNGLTICNLPISGCNFELGTLVDSCDNPPATFGELLQILISQHNS